MSIGKDWGNAYGSAEDTPIQYAALLGDSESDREQALLYFWNSFVHQGSRWEASPYLVPFLFEDLSNADCPLQREIIDLLLGLAVGFGESFLPFGYDIKEEEKQYWDGSWTDLYPYDEARTSYLAVHARSSQLARFLRPEVDREVRLSAAFAVAHFAQALPELHREVASYLGSEEDPGQLQSLLLCYGMLGRFAGGFADTAILYPLLADSQSQSLQVAAAIAITTILGKSTPESAIRPLLAALSNSWTLSSPRTDHQWWNEGDLLGYAALVLRLLGQERRDEIAAAICAALQSDSTCTFALPQTLIDLLFPDQSPGAYRQISEMDVVQRESLRALLQTAHWRSWMFDDRFLPSDLRGDAYRAAFHRFLAEAGAPRSPSSDALGHAGNVSSWDQENHWP